MRELAIALSVYECDYQRLPVDAGNYVSLIFPYINDQYPHNRENLFHCPNDSSQYKVPYSQNGDKLYLSYAFNTRMAGESKETLLSSEHLAIPCLIEAEGASAISAVRLHGIWEFDDDFSERAVRKAASRHLGGVMVAWPNGHIGQTIFVR